MAQANSANDASGAFGVHDTTAKAEFNALDTLRRKSEVVNIGHTDTGATKITVGVNEFTAENALTFSLITSPNNSHSKSLVDRFTYRGSGQGYQRTSRSVGGIKGQIEAQNLITLDT